MIDFPGDRLGLLARQFENAKPNIVENRLVISRHGGKARAGQGGVTGVQGLLHNRLPVAFLDVGGDAAAIAIDAANNDGSGHAESHFVYPKCVPLGTVTKALIR